jgi:hypothetical protein
MAKSIQQSTEKRPLIGNRHEIVQAEINHIANSNPYITTERDCDLYKWLDEQKKSKVSGLVIEDKGSDLSRACFNYFSQSVPQRENLISIPLKVLYVRTSQPGGANHIYIDILNALNRPLNSGTLRDLRVRVKGTLKAYQVQLLIVDDAHVLKRKAMVELIKIYEELKIPVVMSGVYDLEERLSRSKGYEHINNMFLAVHNYRTLTRDELASVVAAWEEAVLELWDEKLNLADSEEMIGRLYTLSSGLVQPLYGYLKKIAIAQLENTLNPSSAESIDIDEVIGTTRPAKVYM